MSAPVGRLVSTVCAAALIICAAPAVAQNTLRISPGIVQEHVLSASDGSQQYAVYLPTAYDSVRVWPLALLMDPRGRALVPLELARAAAERYGYILISSYNTVSDSTVDPNVAAVAAILSDARRFLSVHPRATILVGFSGTARLAWPMSSAYPGIAGILGAGASGTAFARGHAGRVRPVAFYGVVGMTDFNHDEYVLFRPWLERLRLPHRVRTFDGAHSWPPAAYFDEALAWFRLRAMRDSLAAPDTALVERLFARDSAAADSLERTGRIADAHDRWREISDDYAGLRDVSAALGRRTALARDRRTAEQAEERVETATAFFEFSATLGEWLQHLRQDARAPSARRVLNALDVEDLEHEARGDDVEQAAAAARRLEHAFVNLSFYLPRELLAARRPDRALLALDIAERIRPGTPRVAQFRARARAMLREPAVPDTATLHAGPRSGIL